MSSINIRFPLEDDVEKNGLFNLNVVSSDALSSNLLLLLLTRKGERHYQPDYGTNLLKYIFEPKDNQTLEDIQEELRDTVKKYIPQLNIDDVNFYDTRDINGNIQSENQLDIVIDYTFNDDVFSETNSLTISV